MAIIFSPVRLAKTKKENNTLVGQLCRETDLLINLVGELLLGKILRQYHQTYKCVHPLT